MAGFAVDSSFAFGARGWAKKSEAALAGALELASSLAAVVVGGRGTAIPLFFGLLMLELRILLGLELGARPPGWNGVSSLDGRSNIPAGTELSLPKLRFEIVPLPNGEALVALAGVAVGGGLVVCGAAAGVAGEDPKPENGVDAGFAGAAAGTSIAFPKPANGVSAGLGKGASGEPNPPKLRGVEAAAGFAAGAGDAATGFEAGAGDGVLLARGQAKIRSQRTEWTLASQELQQVH